MIKNRSARKLIWVATACGLLTLSVGCERIGDPWVRSPDQLEQERDRPEAAREILRNRLHAVQTDR